MTEDELAALAASTGKMLRWAGFLLAVMLLILLVDLQLKRSIGRQAITAADRYGGIINMADRIMADLKKGAGGGRGQAMAEAHAHGSHPGDDGGVRVAGDARMAAGDDQGGDTPPDVPAAAPDRKSQRTPGNGRRARGTAQ